MRAVGLVAAGLEGGYDGVETDPQGVPGLLEEVVVHVGNDGQLVASLQGFQGRDGVGKDGPTGQGTGQGVDFAPGQGDAKLAGHDRQYVTEDPPVIQEFS